MAKTQRRDQVNRRRARQAKAGQAAAEVKPVRGVQVTLGDLIVAAFDAVGGEVKKVAKVMSSPAMTLATGKHIVVVS